MSTTVEELDDDSPVHPGEHHTHGPSTSTYFTIFWVLVAITALVVLAEQSRREARRNRAADAMLVRVGMGARGVRANVINPGPIDTGWMTDEIRESGIAQTPAGRNRRIVTLEDGLLFGFGPRTPIALRELIEAVHSLRVAGDVRVRP